MSQALGSDFLKLQKRIEALHRQNSKLNERLVAERQQSSEAIKALELQLSQHFQQKHDEKPAPQVSTEKKAVIEEAKVIKTMIARRPRVEQQTDELDLEALLGAPFVKKP